jgi:hypothetical protein
MRIFAGPEPNTQNCTTLSLRRFHREKKEYGWRQSSKKRLDWVPYLAHEVNSSLGLVEGGGGHVNVEHHLPLAGPHRLVEAKPNLAPSAQRVVVPLGAERIRD